MGIQRLKIPGFEYKPTCPQESLEAAIDWLDNTAPKKAGRAIPYDGTYSNLGVHAEFIKGGISNPLYTYPCHAMLGHGQGNRDCVALYCVGPEGDYWKRWYSWFINESFASEYFLYTSDNGVVVSSDIPAPVLHAIAMTGRSARQMDKGFFDLFNSHLDRGTPPEIAYLAVFGSKNSEPDVKYVRSLNHRPWASPGILGYKDFINGDVAVTNLYTFRHNRDQHCSGFIRPGNLVRELFLDKDFKSRLSDLRKENTSEETYRPPNPFAKKSGSAIPAGEVSVREYHEFVIPYCLEKGLFNG